MAWLITVVLLVALAPFILIGWMLCYLFYLYTKEVESGE